MKKFTLTFCIALSLQMSCEKLISELTGPTVYRCENEEVVCYVDGWHGGVSCKFKEGVL